jgi:hypothetical protein
VVSRIVRASSGVMFLLSLVRTAREEEECKKRMQAALAAEDASVTYWTRMTVETVRPWSHSGRVVAGDSYLVLSPKTYSLLDKVGTSNLSARIRRRKKYPPLGSAQHRFKPSRRLPMYGMFAGRWDGENICIRLGVP